MTEDTDDDDKLRPPEILSWLDANRRPWYQWDFNSQAMREVQGPLTYLAQLGDA